MANPIILDTDPGIDDAIAMIVLFAHCKERVQLMVSSYGNISIEKTTKNALTMTSLCKVDIPVLKGASLPDNDSYIDAPHIHGADGLGDLEVSVPTAKPVDLEGDYLQYLFDTICKAGKVDYITLGPLTNLARLIKRFPEVLSHINSVVAMGGGFDMGNVTPHAEFNIHCDAEAADYVFSLGSLPEHPVKISLIPLNTSITVAFSLEQIAQIEAIGTPLALAASKILTANYHSCVGYGEHGSTMHDASAVLYYLFPELFSTEQCKVTVDCTKQLYGKTVKQNNGSVTVTKHTKAEELLLKITQSIRLL